MNRPGNANTIRRKPFLGTFASIGLVVASVCGLLAASPSVGHSQAKNVAAAPAYEFETASIKLNKSNFTTFRPGFTLDGYRAECIGLQWLIREAYGVEEYALSAVPDRLYSEHYDVEAKMDPSVADALSKLTPTQLKLARQQMLQALLAERFNLKVHRETKDEPVYFLVIGKNGPKLQDAKTRASTMPNADGTPARGRMEIDVSPGSEGGQKIYAYSTAMKSLADFLTRQLSRPVLDKTGLTGTYDFTLDWIPDAAPTSSPNDTPTAVTLSGIPGASLFTAVQQQLGLKLEPGKGAIEMLVIDHVEKPSSN